jgi:hypothetical protein
VQDNRQIRCTLQPPAIGDFSQARGAKPIQLDGRAARAGDFRNLRHHIQGLFSNDYMVNALAHYSKGLGDNLWTLLPGWGLVGQYDFSLAYDKQ